MTSSFKESDWYQTPLYYDIVFEEDTSREAWFMGKMLDQYGGTGGDRVLEPACGSGRLVEEMARRGYEVSGFDLSPDMLEFASRRLRKAKLSADLSVQRLESFRYRKKFDLAHCGVSTFKYLLDEKSCVAHLSSVAKALKVGGLYVLSFHLSEYDNPACSRERWEGVRDGTRVICNIQSWPPDASKRVEKVRSRLIVEEKGEIRRMETKWLFRTYDSAQVRRLLKKVKSLEHVATYDFTYSLDSKRDFNDHQLDNVLILRKI